MYVYVFYKYKITVHRLSFWMQLIVIRIHVDSVQASENISPHTLVEDALHTCITWECFTVHFERQLCKISINWNVQIRRKNENQKKNPTYQYYPMVKGWLLLNIDYDRNIDYDDNHGSSFVKIIF